MIHNHLDDIATCVFRDKGRNLENACWLLNKARIPTPSGRKEWQRQEVAVAVVRHEQRERDHLEKHAGN